MSSRTDPLSITPDVDRWRIDRPFSYEIGKLGSGLVVTVGTGFLSDLGTIPWWLHWLVSPHDPNKAQAFVLHDCMLESGFPRRTADAVFAEALLALKVDPLLAALLFRAVRLYAFIARKS